MAVLQSLSTESADICAGKFAAGTPLNGKSLLRHRRGRPANCHTTIQLPVETGPRVSWVKPHPEADSPLSGDYFVQPASERKKVEFGLGLSFTSFTEQLGVAE